MKTFKEVAKSSLAGILISVLIFVIAGVVFDIVGGGTFTLADYGFTKMVLACLATGIAFGAPSVLYSKESVSKGVATVVQLTIGFAVYAVVGSYVGWIPIKAGLAASLLTLAGALVIVLIIWYCFYRYNKNLANRMNDVLKKK